MARKRPESEIAQALQTQAAHTPCDTCPDGHAVINLHGVNVCMPCYEHAHATKAADAMEAAGLLRRRNEPMNEWHFRVQSWLKVNSVLFRNGDLSFPKPRETA